MARICQQLLSVAPGAAFDLSLLQTLLGSRQSVRNSPSHFSIPFCNFPPPPPSEKRLLARQVSPAAQQMQPTQTVQPPQPTGGRRRRVVDEDPDERRRKFLERNRAAATRCRQKRKVWVMSLEKKAEELTQTNMQLQVRATVCAPEDTEGLFVLDWRCLWGYPRTASS